MSSRMKASQRKEHKSILVTKTQDLLMLVYQYQTNTKVIPKAYRNTLGKDMINTAKNLHNSVIYTNSIRIVDEDTRRRRLVSHTAIRSNIETFSSEITMLFELNPKIKHKTIQGLSKRIDEISRIEYGVLSRDTNTQF